MVLRCHRHCDWQEQQQSFQRRRPVISQRERSTTGALRLAERTSIEQLAAMTYFDHNATSPVHESARKGWNEATERYPGNPSSSHRLGRRAEAVLAVARDRVAAFLGCDPEGLLWTSGATESANLVLHHLARTLPDDREVWVSAIEHPCVLAPARDFFGERLRLVPVGHEGVVAVAWLRAQLAVHRPGAIAIMAANNETGVLQPWQEVRTLCRDSGAVFVCDATQWLGRLPAAGLGECDYVFASAHKCGGPRGVGFCKVPSGETLHPQLRGGGQERGRRAGTENLAGILAATAAVETREWQIVADEAAARQTWRDAFERQLASAVPGTLVVGVGQPRLWNTSLCVLPPLAGETRWAEALDNAGFAVSSGAACASGPATGSQLLVALGYSADEASRAVRFSAGWETTEAEWQTLADACHRIWEQALPTED